MNTWNRLATGASLILAIGVSQTARAETVYEHFNNYGTLSADLAGLSGSETAGWFGPWASGVQNRPDYYAGEQLIYNASGYNNGPNEADLDDGDAGDDPAATAGQVVERAFTTPMTGTIWVSALSRFNAPTGGDTLLWLNKIGSATSNFIAIRGVAGTLRFQGGNGDKTAGMFAIDTTHLLLAKIQLDVDGLNDAIDFWINPDLSGGETGLGTPLLSNSGADAYGSEIRDIAISFSLSNDRLDALRFSDEADGFTKVTSITTPPLAGDFDEDGDVDGDDLADWKAGFGAPTGATHMQGDADGDEDVDGADFLTWQRQVGSGVAPSANSVAAIPEPTCAALLVAGGALGLMLARRRRGLTSNGLTNCVSIPTCPPSTLRADGVKL